MDFSGVFANISLGCLFLDYSGRYMYMYVRLISLHTSNTRDSLNFAKSLQKVQCYPSFWGKFFGVSEQFSSKFHVSTTFPALSLCNSSVSLQQLRDSSAIEIGRVCRMAPNIVQKLLIVKYLSSKYFIACQRLLIFMLTFREKR